ncbi:MAG: DUF1080 domain-containing protein, partial [Planctomycetota bacterium]|nr:DUF1080 domain-containing protein [Planctomycetota bacterium]
LALLSERGRDAVEHVLAHPLPELRATAIRALDSEDPARLARHLGQLARDPEPFVRALVARLVRDYDDELRLQTLEQLVAMYPGDDRAYLESLGIGAEGLEEQVLESALALARDRVLDTQRLLEVLWRAHPPSSVATLASVAGDAELPIEMRRRMLDALAFVPSRDAADAMFVLGASGPEDLRDHARWWSRHRAGNDWRAYDFQPTAEVEGLEGAQRVFGSGVMRGAGFVDIDVPVAGSEHLFLVVTDGGDGMSCDWAAWVAPRFVLEDGTDVSLKSLGWVAEQNGFGTTHFDRNCEGGPLRIGDDTFSEGIGTHAASRIQFKVPEKALRLVAQAGPDFGGTGRSCGTSIEFEVWLKGSVGGGTVLAQQRAAREGDLEVIATLAQHAAGGLYLISLAEEDGLSDEARAVAGQHIFRNPDPGVRALASAHFPRPGGLQALPPVGELLALVGNAGRGQQLFFTERATCATCHAFEGQGKDIGPDLTVIREKYDRAQLLDAILNPSAGIAFGYDTHVVRTVDGQIASGFVLAEGQDLLLKDTQGLRHVFPVEDIEVRKKQTLSVMPEGVALGLSPQEIADLLAFLTTPGQREPEFGEPIALFNGLDLTGWTHHLRGEDADPDEVWSVAGGSLRCEGKPAGYIRTEADYTNYELTLEWRFLPERGAGNSGVLLRMTGEDKVWPKSIESQLMSRNAGDIWNIDQFPMLVDPARTEGRRTKKLLPTNEKPFGEWNRYRIRLDKGELTIAVNGALQNSARFCEEVAGKICLQSEGAYIEFRNIALRPIVN